MMVPGWGSIQFSRLETQSSQEKSHGMLGGRKLQGMGGEPESMWTDRRKLPLLLAEVRIVVDGLPLLKFQEVRILAWSLLLQ